MKNIAIINTLKVITSVILITISVIIFTSTQKVDFTTGTRAAECSVCDEADDAESKCKYYKTQNNVSKCGWESDIAAAKAECSRCKEQSSGRKECRTRDQDASYCKDGRSKIITTCDSCNPEKGCTEEEVCYGGPIDPGGNVTTVPGKPTNTPVPTAAPGSYEQGTNCKTPGGSTCADADFNDAGYAPKGMMLCCKNIKYERVENGKTMKYGVAEPCEFKCGAAQACANAPGGTHTSADECGNPVTCPGVEPTPPPQTCVDQSQGFYCDDFSKDNPDAYCKRFETIKNTCTNAITFRKTDVNCCTKPGEPTPPVPPTSTPKPRTPGEPTPTTPPERSPHACVRSTISKTQIAPGDTVEVCTEASIEARSHTFAFYNLGNLYGPGNPKGIFYQQGIHYVLTNATQPITKTRCVTFTYADVNKPDLNAGGTVPKTIQINGYFTDPNYLFSRPDAKCVVQLTMVPGPTTPPSVTPTRPPQEVTPTPTNPPTPTTRPSNTPTPTVTPVPQPQTCGYTPCDDAGRPCANGLVCLLTSTGQKYCSKPEYESRCYDNPSQTSCCSEPTPTPTTRPTNTPSPTPSPRPAQCGYPCGEDQGVCQNGEICVQSTDGRRYCSMPEHQQRCATNGGGYTNCCTAPTPTPQPTYTPVPSPTPQPTYTPIPPPPQQQQVIVQQQQPQQVIVQQQQQPQQVIQQVVQQVQPTYTPVPPPPTYTLIPTFTQYPTQPPQATYTPVPPPPVSGNPIPWIVVGTPVLLMLLGMVL